MARHLIFFGLISLAIIAILSNCVQTPKEKPLIGVKTINTSNGTSPNTSPKKPIVFNTPIPPEGVLRTFSYYYNERNSTAIYLMLSDIVKANYTLADIEEELRFAEKYGVKIIKQKALNETVKGNLHILRANLTLMIGKEVKEISIDFPVRYVSYVYEADKYRVIRYIESIDEWIFDDLHSRIPTET